MNIASESKITLRVITAAKMFFPPLILAIVFSVLLVLISLANPIFVRIGDYQFPILIPYFENLTKVGCYIVVYIAFLSLFISVTFRDYAIRFFRRMERKRISLDTARSLSTTSQSASDRRLARENIRAKWQLAQLDRRLRDLEQRQRLSRTENGHHDLEEAEPVEPITHFEVSEILAPMVCVVILTMLLLWPIVLIITLIVVTILAIRGTLKTALTRLIEFVFRFIFKGASRL